MENQEIDKENDLEFIFKKGELEEDDDEEDEEGEEEGDDEEGAIEDGSLGKRKQAFNAKKLKRKGRKLELDYEEPEEEEEDQALMETLKVSTDF